MSESSARKPFTTVEAEFLAAGVEMDEEASRAEAQAPKLTRWQAVRARLEFRAGERWGALAIVSAGILLLGIAALWSSPVTHATATPPLAVAKALAAAPMAPGHR